MERELTGSDRRKRLVALMREAGQPLSGTKLGQATGVSRQVVVQDIALLRTEGYAVVSTARGYLLEQETQAKRLFKVFHTDAQVEDELTVIVDTGGTVLDVMVNHRVYGKMTAPLRIANRRDVKMFVNDLKTGKSAPLLNVTAGYHFHHVGADSEEILDEIADALHRKGYLAKLLPYEAEAFTAEEI